MTGGSVQRAALSDDFGHLRILASAGSGKTYQLTSRYIALIAAGAAPSSILASTFTRAAAGEIRDRVLLRLADAADNGPKRRGLGRELGLGDLDADRTLAWLRTLTRHQHELQIRTLDSFFARIVGGFALELGVPPGCRIVDESAAAELRREAIDRMLDERDPQPLIDLLRQLADGAAPRGVTETIDATVASLHGVWRQSAAAAWDCIPAPEHQPLSPAALVDAIRGLEAADPGDDRRFMAAHQAACACARAWDWQGFLSSGLAKALAAGSDTFARKPISGALTGGFEPLIHHARASLLQRLRDRQHAAWEILSRFDGHYREISRRRRTMTFSDVTDAVLRAITGEALPMIAYRLDATLHHVLLDEMQDTSIVQWRALEPMARELVSHAPPQRTFFCVGDAKQSIYGWRDACPDVLQEIPNLLVGADGSTAVGLRTLARSYRSSPIVLDVVNRVFSDLPSRAALADWPEVARAWAAMFQTHSAADRVEDAPGYVQLCVCARADDDEAQEEARLANAAQLIAKLHTSGPGLEIGVLTRTNKAAARLLFELGSAGLNLPASMRGPGSITDAAPVNAVLDLLRLADHPDDTASAFNVANGPLGRAVGLSRHDCPSTRRRVSASVRRELLTDSYAATISRWVAALADSCQARELGRLLRLVSLARQHDPGASLRCDDFVRFAQASSVGDYGQTPIQVMTVHQAKGLEFDAVVLADLDTELLGRTPRFVVERRGTTGPILRVCNYLNDGLRSLAPNLEPMFDAHRQRTVHESLSLLYVGLTRTRHGLYMVIDPPKFNKDGQESKRSRCTLAGVVRSALVGAEVAVEPDRVIFDAGEPDWPARIAAASPAASVPPPVGPIRLRSSRARVAAAPRPSAAADAGQRLARVDHNARLRGTILHALFQQIQWLDEFDVSDDDLFEAVRFAARRADQALIRTCVADFRRMLQRQVIQDLLSRGGRADSSLTLYRELPFARLTAEGMQQGTIDRLVAEHDPPGAAGLFKAASVIDFKTSRFDEATARAAARDYRSQLDAYRLAAAELLRIEPDRVTTTILFVEPGLAV